MSWITDLLTSGGFGSILGGIGGMAGKVIKQRSDLLLAKENNRHVEKLQELQQKADDAERAAELWITDLKGSLENVGKSIVAEQALGEGVSQPVADKRAMFRMRATVYSWICTMLTLGLGLSFNYTADPMFQKVLNMEIMVASASMFFWFGGKAISSRHT